MNKSSLEELKQDMEDKRKTAAAYADAAAAAAAAAAAYEAAASAAAAYTAYAAAYDADAYDVYEAAKKKYEKALEQAPVASSDGPSELQVSRWFGESTIKFHISDRMNYIAQKAWQAALEKDNE